MTQSLKRKAADGKNGRFSKPSARVYDDSSPEPDFSLHSATSDIGGRMSPRIPEPRYSSTLSGRDEEFLMSNLKKLQLDAQSGSGSNHNSSIPPPPPSGSRMQRDNHVSHNGPPPHPYGHFGQPMPMGLGSMGQMPPMGPMGLSDHMHPMNGGALAHYGAFPPAGAYGPPGSSFGHGAPPSSQMHPYPGYGGAPNFQGSALARHSQPPLRHNSHSTRGSESQTSMALVLRRNDDSEIDPETKVWKDMFLKLFTGCFGWASSHCKEITPGAVEAATKNSPRLWEYILKVAACYKDPQAAPKHALFMLNSPEHRLHFISRLLLQYVEQEMLQWKFWLGWDDEVDLELNKIGPIIDHTGYGLEMRRAARHKLRSIVEGIVKDEEYSRFRSFKTSQHASRLRDIAGPFLSKSSSISNGGGGGGASEASVGLHSMANMGMELSNKMMTSRLSFAFTWNDCAVKFCHDSHIALNSSLNGMALQHKHIRIALVVTPSVSYRDDTGPSIVPRGVTKAQVLVMN